MRRSWDYEHRSRLRRDSQTRFARAQKRRTAPLRTSAYVAVISGPAKAGTRTAADEYAEARGDGNGKKKYPNG